MINKELYVIQNQQGKFYGGESFHSHIWRDEPAFAYRFPTKEAAREVAEKLKDVEIVTILTTMWNFIINKQICGLPLTEEEKKYMEEVEEKNKKVREKTKEIEKILKKDLNDFLVKKYNLPKWDRAELKICGTIWIEIPCTEFGSSCAKAVAEFLQQHEAIKELKALWETKKITLEFYNLGKREI